jgi:hypothetical protein
MKDGGQFDYWIQVETETLRKEHAKALKDLARLYQARGETELAISSARRWLALTQRTSSRTVFGWSFHFCWPTQCSCPPERPEHEIYMAIVRDGLNPASFSTS